jgi:hypothetical protein
MSGTHDEFLNNGIIEESNVQKMSRSRAKIVFTLLFLFRESNNTIEDAYVEVATHIGAICVGRSKLPIFAIADRLKPPGKETPEITFSIDKFPSMKGLILENTYRFNNILLVDYLVPIYNAAKAVCTISRPMADLVANGTITLVRPVASNSEKFLMRLDLRPRPSPDAYTIRISDENAVWHEKFNNTTVRQAQGDIELGDALKVEPRRFARLIDEALQQVVENISNYKMPTNLNKDS